MGSGRIPTYFSADGTGTAGMVELAAAVRTLLGAADASAARTAIDAQQLNSALTAIAALTPSNDDVLQRKSGAWTNRTLAQLRTDLGIPAPRIMQIAVTDPNGSALTTGDGKAYVRINSQLNGLNLSAVAAHVTTVSSSGLVIIQIHNVTDAADMLTTRITIDASEKDSATAAAAAVINASVDDVATGDELRIDVDGAGTGTKGLIVELTFS